jgi:hypothetical protein
MEANSNNYLEDREAIKEKLVKDAMKKAEQIYPKEEQPTKSEAKQL